jgi:dTDP-4-dehydrorhamnose 3,5-epimerase
MAEAEPDYNPNLVHIAGVAHLARPHEPRSIEAGGFGRLLFDVFPWTDVRIDVLTVTGPDAFEALAAADTCHELAVVRGRAELRIAGVAATLSDVDSKVIRIPGGVPYAVRALPNASALLVRYRHRRRASCNVWRPSRLRFLDVWKGIAGVADVARRHADDRGRRWGDVFATEHGDVNITWAYPGVITAWHAHTAQDDNWFVLAGALKVGLATREADGFAARFVHQSGFEQVALQIPIGVLHGWRNFTQEEAILMYYITNKYDPANPDEQRFSLAEVGADWSTPVR